MGLLDLLTQCSNVMSAVIAEREGATALTTEGAGVSDNMSSITNKEVCDYTLHYI